MSEAGRQERRSRARQAATGRPPGAWAPPLKQSVPGALSRFVGSIR